MASRPNVSRGDKLGCETTMKVRGNDTLEGAHSFAWFWTQISSFSRHFLETLTETGSIHWVGVSYIFGKLMTNGMQWWVVHDILGSLGGH